ncbi:hypothetical protein [Mesorhizobium sp. B2-6-5]|uniref:hypothetical protein n=1 Tax=Mesorhizobium sp. B2-6-5 TaxID=2589912 RepID=UPI001FF04F52|nr:hypothetical protein [Mesorhizobium sp. B2-6-5]
MYSNSGRAPSPGYFRSKDELFARAALFDLQLPATQVTDRASIGDAIIRRFLRTWENSPSATGMVGHSAALGCVQ